MYMRLLCVATAWLCTADFLSAATLYSRANGSWSTVGTWSYTAGGASCGCTPIASDDVTIHHTVNMDKHLTNVGSSLNGITGILTVSVTGSLLGGSTYDLDIRSTGRLYLCGTLTTRDLTFSNGSIVNVCSTGNLVVNRDFFNKNNSNSITIDGTMTVHGEYENGNGGIIAGSGTINITNGPVTNTGSTFGCEGYDPCYNVYPCSIVSPCLSPLPVTFLDVKAEWPEDRKVIVYWATGSEVNNDHFDVLRSVDGVNFSGVGSVAGNGTTSQAHAYSMTDTELPPVQLLYYRIRQVDYDGQWSTSRTVAVSRKPGRLQVHLFPNPIHSGESSFINLLVETTGSRLHFDILDATGRIVLSQSETPEGSFVDVRIPVPSLAAGMYLFRVTNGEQEFTCKLVSLK